MDATPEASTQEPSDVVSRASAMSVSLFVRAQDLVTLLAGATLVLLSGTLLVSGIVDFFDALSGKSVTSAATILLDRVLLVLIIVEIVHTVVLSLRAHTLVPQPFIVVGLVAVIRRILFVLGSDAPVGTAELALLLAMVAVFIAGLIAVSRFTRRTGQGEDPALF